MRAVPRGGDGAGRPGRAAAPKFRRIARAARREALIAATLRCLRRDGHDGASVRRISAEAGVSMGLINHHFAGSASLIAAAYESLSVALIAAARRDVAAARGLAPAARLGRFFAASFAPEALDPGLFRIWLVFWSMVAHAPEIRAVHQRTGEQHRALLEGLLRALRRAPGAAPFRVTPAAIGLAALMDGLWVDLSLNPASSTAAAAVALCNDWVAALAAGAFPGLASAAVRRRRAPRARRSGS
ncbi:MAG TPA: TetR/AcrR family transcriptional regulator [Steroidobacteraceae bacterium]|nr:TetR/AcrR family transcriptional regulator [Steroidobacteraceae bacterium]